ncbi:thiol reductant ABC exporter subunit CydD [Candidatus Flexifilum breve]|uniref:thiol reductant ABC exporter subunit CydD n=1 Tax=Candidatus Flexifilum breve TaxID=3140694 RepID=UPI0031CC7C9E
MDRRLIAEARAVRREFALSILWQTLAGACLIGGAFAFSRTVAAVFLGGQPLSAVLPLLGLFGGCALLRAGLVWAGNSAAAEVSIRVRLDLRRRLLKQLVQLGAQDARTGELATTASKGIDALDPYFRDYLPALFTALLIPLTMALVVLPLDGLTFAVMLITAPLIPFFMILIGKAAGVLAKTQYASLGLLSAHFLDVMQGLLTLKLFNRSQYQIETIGRISGEFRAATMGVLRVAFLSALTLELLATVSVALIAVEIGVRLLHGGIPFESALFLLVIAPEFYQPLRTLGARFHTGTEASAAAARIFEVLALPCPPAGAVTAPPHSDLRFDAVHVAYDAGERPALNGLSFTVAHGEKVALVGATGGGKSTALALLLRFSEPTAGRITVNGRDLRELDADTWRQQIAWVPQAPYLFNTSIADNIRLGRPDAPLTDVLAAAAAAQAHDFITRLPHGYDTVIGERGARLSGGQAQRVAIARAFLRDAPLLLLDEITSYLDHETEAALNRALDRLLVGRTALVVAHRLHTIQRMDRILVVEAGQVVESGTHAELLAHGGRYQRLIARTGGRE